MIRRLRRLRLRREERGYSLIELLTVMMIMGVVMSGLTQVFTSAAKADNDMSRRFQAQLDTRLALDKLRRDVHCGTDVTPYAANSLTIRLPAGCGGDVSYCTAAMVGVTGRWSLYRQTGGSCSASGVKLAGYLTTANVFTGFTTHTVDTLSSLSVDLPIRVSSGTAGTYELKDTIYMRNSTRT